jgi:hypothetical protein
MDVLSVIASMVCVYVEKYKLVGTVIKECNCGSTGSGNDKSNDCGGGPLPTSSQAPQQRTRGTTSGMCSIL